jgi:hypothetical protein
MNLSLLRRPNKINKNTRTMYIYHPSVVTTSNVLEPGDVLRILDVFEGATTSETTLKVMTAKDWEDHRYGRTLPACTKLDMNVYDPNWRILCDCEKELSEMDESLKARVHYVLLSDVGK